MFKNVSFPDDSVMAEDKMSQNFVSQARGGSHPQSSALAACPNHHHLSWRLAPAPGHLFHVHVLFRRSRHTKCCRTK